MPDEEITETVETPSTEGTPTKETPTGEKPDDDGTDELPKWAREKLTKANAEAANYRTRLREAEKKLEGAKNPEEFEKAIAEFKAQNAGLEANLLRERVARKFNLPEDLAVRLRGATAEELESDAKALQKYAVTPPPGDLRGGLDPSDEDEPFDPVKAARQARKSRY